MSESTLRGNPPLRVAVVFNAPVLAKEHPDAASERGAADCAAAMLRVLQERGVEAVEVPLGDSAAALRAVARLAAEADVVVNLCEGLGGASALEPAFASLLELAGVAFTGCPAEALSLTHDKAVTSAFLRSVGVPTPEHAVVTDAVPLDEARLRALLDEGALIVKPAREDASLGVTEESVVSTLAEAGARVAALHARFGDVVVERFLPGREFNLTVLALPEPRVLPVAEIAFSGAARLVTYDAKWTPGSDAYAGTPVTCPADVTPALEAELKRLALAAFHATRCRDVARVDLRLDAAGRPQVLEVNANPDLSPDAGVARAARAAGLSYDALVCALVESAAGRRTRSALRRDERGEPGRLCLRQGAAEDAPLLAALTRRTEAFREDELETAAEVVRDALAGVDDGHYRLLVVERDRRVVGWSCHGLVPLSDGAWDLYWIVVDPDVQGVGLGRALLGAVEADVAALGGRWVLAETSDSAGYTATRRFYERAGYVVVGDVPDFYRDGDGRLTFGKRVRPSAAAAAGS